MADTESVGTTTGAPTDERDESNSKRQRKLVALVAATSSPSSSVAPTTPSSSPPASQQATPSSGVSPSPGSDPVVTPSGSIIADMRKTEARKARASLNDKFHTLSGLVESTGLDRADILQAAIDRLSQRGAQQFVHGFPALNTCPNLEQIATAYLTLDGKFVDANRAWLQMFNFQNLVAAAAKASARPNTPSMKERSLLAAAAASGPASSSGASTSSSLESVAPDLTALRRHTFLSLASPFDVTKLSRLLTALLQNDVRATIETKITFVDFSGQTLERSGCILSALRKRGVLKLLMVMCIPEFALDSAQAMAFAASLLPHVQQAQHAHGHTPSPPAPPAPFQPFGAGSVSQPQPQSVAQQPYAGMPQSSAAYLQQARQLQNASRPYAFLPPPTPTTAPNAAPTFVPQPPMYSSTPPPPPPAAGFDFMPPQHQHHHSQQSYSPQHHISGQTAWSSSAHHAVATTAAANPYQQQQSYSMQQHVIHTSSFTPPASPVYGLSTSRSVTMTPAEHAHSVQQQQHAQQLHQQHQQQQQQHQHHQPHPQHPQAHLLSHQQQWDHHQQSQLQLQKSSRPPSPHSYLMMPSQPYAHSLAAYSPAPTTRSLPLAQPSPSTSIDDLQQWISHQQQVLMASQRALITAANAADAIAASTASSQAGADAASAAGSVVPTAPGTPGFTVLRSTIAVKLEELDPLLSPIPLDRSLVTPAKSAPVVPASSHLAVPSSQPTTSSDSELVAPSPSHSHESSVSSSELSSDGTPPGFKRPLVAVAQSTVALHAPASAEAAAAAALTSVATLTRSDQSKA